MNDDGWVMIVDNSFIPSVAQFAGPSRGNAPKMRPLKAGGSNARTQADLNLVGGASVASEVETLRAWVIGGAP